MTDEAMTQEERGQEGPGSSTEEVTSQSLTAFLPVNRTSTPTVCSPIFPSRPRVCCRRSPPLPGPSRAHFDADLIPFHVSGMSERMTPTCGFPALPGTCGWSDPLALQALPAHSRAPCQVPGSQPLSCSLLPFPSSLWQLPDRHQLEAG